MLNINASLLRKVICETFFCFFCSFCSAEDWSVSDSDWEFSLEPFAHLSKNGNVTYGNTLFIMFDKQCRGRMTAGFSSYNKEELLQTDGKILPVEFSITLNNKKKIAQSETKVISAQKIIYEDMEMLYAIAYLDLIPIDNISELRDLADNKQASFDLTAEDDVIFDIPHESWDLNGFTPALKKAITWCGRKIHKPNSESNTSSALIAANDI